MSLGSLKAAAAEPAGPAASQDGTNGTDSDHAERKQQVAPSAAQQRRQPHGAHEPLSWAAFALLSWTSVGVILGDIATSPLYVYQSVFAELKVDTLERSDVLGAASLVFWTLTLLVLVKYCCVVLRADDHGQGGTFALYSLLCRHMGVKPHGVRGPALAPAVAHSMSTGRRRRGRSRAAALRPGGNAGAGTHPASVREHARAGAAGDGAAPAAGGGDASDASSDSGSEEGGEERGPPKGWWRRWAADGEAVRAFFRRSRRAQVALWGVAVVATAMLIGDGVLTPSISVLSAVSGLKVAVPSLSQGVVVAVALVVLCFVFSLQHFGTGKVGLFFAPIIALWLLSNAAINLYNIARYGGAVFQALSPTHISTYFARHGLAAWRSLGGVMLCVTGTEALFADLGHFSRGSITMACGVLAYPCLVITYLGQAAHVIHHPGDKDAFWKSLPGPLLYPMLVLATLATIVASQALISGVFSILRQAMLLGAFPPVRVVHTGGREPGAATQVYVPLANVLLLLLCCAVVGGFRNTVALGKAYGLAVVTDMLNTTCLVTLVMVVVWELGLPLVLAFFSVFFAVEALYWSASIIKVVEGGWFVILIAASTATLMFTWWAGSRRLGELLAAATAGARIRLLGLPRPQHPLLPPVPRPPQPPPQGPALRSTQGPALRSTSARIAAPAEPLLSRLSSWALRRRVTSSGFGTAPVASSVPLPGLGLGLEMRSLPTPVSKGQSGDPGTAYNRPTMDTECAFYGLPPGTLALELPAGTSSCHWHGGGGRGAAVAGAADPRDVEMASAAASAATLVVPLTRLEGVGVYYMDEKVGDAEVVLPPVLVHFLRNVKAIHSVCVFLSVRRLPLPAVARRRRLHVFTPRNATPLNFYHVISFYGYLDRVDHGPAFLNELLGAITRSLAAAAARAHNRGADRGPAASSLWADSGFGAGTGESDSNSRGAPAAAAEAGDVGESLARTGLRCPKPAELLAGCSGGSVAAAGASADTAAAAAAMGAGVHPDVVERAAADFLQAQLHGVVYYASRAQLRSPTHPAPAAGPFGSWFGLVPLGRWVVFGLLFRWLAAVAFVDMESWRVPPERLVELGMPVEIW